MKNKIICGFAGIGKSYLAKHKESFVDLESTPFQKNWDLYSNVAIHMQKNGYTPLLSCHKELRYILKEKNADYVVVIPRKEHKKAYIQRYKERGNDEQFIALFDKMFEVFIDEIESIEKNIFYLEKDYMTLADIIN